MKNYNVVIPFIFEASAREEAERVARLTGFEVEVHEVEDAPDHLSGTFKVIGHADPPGFNGDGH